MCHVQIIITTRVYFIIVLLIVVCVCIDMSSTPGLKALQSGGREERGTHPTPAQCCSINNCRVNEQLHNYSTSF